MKTIGIIAEYNPFHKGHSYLIETAKEVTGADYAIIAMSGDYVQRGEAACVDKYLRTQIALSEGADVIFELPTIFATASAEYFARGAVDLLAATGVVSAICFGTSHPDFPYEEIAKLLLHPSDAFNEAIKKNLSSGDHFALARAKAICADSAFSSISEFSAEQLAEPNTILGMEYAKAALQKGISIVPIKRVGNGYHDTSAEGTYLSASAIRMQMKVDIHSLSGISSQEKDALTQYSANKKLLTADSLSDILYHALLINEDEGYTKFFDCDVDLSNRIQKNLKNYKSCSQFAELLKTKNYTYARISRVLLHIALSITQSEMDELNKCDSQAFYLRLLGFRKSASAVLSEIKKSGLCPMISKMADASSLLSDDAYRILKKDIYAADIFEQLAQGTTRKENELTRSPIII